MNRKFFFFFFFFIAASTEADCARKHHSCCIYELIVPKLPTGEVSFINGINHTPDRAAKCAMTLSNMGGGYNIYLVYNPTGGFFADLRSCFWELFHFEITEPVKKLLEKWDMFFSEHPIQSDKYLQFCHSEGAIQVRNALLRYPPTLRKRIIVVAIAPAAYIPNDLCCRVFHYVSRRDIVPNLDHKGRKRCKATTVVLTPHRQAAFFDHHFLSPTYRSAIEYHLSEYLTKEIGVCCD